MTEKKLTLDEARAKFASERGVSQDIDESNLALIAELEAQEAPSDAEEVQAPPAKTKGGK